MSHQQTFPDLRQATAAAMANLPRPVRVLCDRTETDRDAWLTLRDQGLGGSEIAKVAGIARFGGALGTFLRKRHEIADDDPGEEAEWGIRLEPVIRQKTAEATGAIITPLPFLIADTERPWMLADLDGIIFDPIYGTGGFEAKTAGAFMADDWTDGVPAYYEAQVQWYMEITGLRYFRVAVLIGGQKFKHFKVDYDPEAAAALVAAGHHFWFDHLLPGIEPEPTAGDTPKSYFPEGDPEASRDLPAELVDAYAELQRIKNNMAPLEARRAELEAQFQAALGQATTGYLPGVVVKWGTATGRTTLDAKALKADHPDIYQHYARTGDPYRTGLKFKEV